MTTVCQAVYQSISSTILSLLNKTSLLRYNSYTTHLFKVQFSGLLYSQICATIITVNFRKFYHLKKKHLLFSQHTATPPPKSKTITKILSFSVDFHTLDFHTLDFQSSQYVYFWYWLLSLSVFQGSSKSQRISDTYCFYDRVILHCMDTPHFIYPFVFVDGYLDCFYSGLLWVMLLI